MYFHCYTSIACLVCLSPFTWSKIITNNRNTLLYIYIYINILNIHVTNTSCKHHCTLRYTCPWKSRHGAGPPRVCWPSLLLSLSLFLVVVFKSLSFFLHSSTERWHGPSALTLNYQRWKNWSLHMFYLGCSYYFIHTGFIIFVPYIQISLVHVCFEKEKTPIHRDWLTWMVI